MSPMSPARLAHRRVFIERWWKEEARILTPVWTTDAAGQKQKTWSAGAWIRCQLFWTRTIVAPQQELEEMDRYTIRPMMRVPIDSDLEEHMGLRVHVLHGEDLPTPLVFEVLSRSDSFSAQSFDVLMLRHIEAPS